jgi:hypothetical protein
MSERLDRLLGAISPWEREDPNVLGVMTVYAGELDGVEDLMTAVRDQAWPHRADDTYGLLALHERSFGLPVGAGELSVEQRQQQLKTRVGRRRDGRKATWVDRLAELIAPATFTYQENHPAAHQITITLNVPIGSGLATQVLNATEAFTPVVDEVIVTYAPTFFIGVSPIGDTEL